MADLSAEMERYDGFWNADGKHTPDPPNSRLYQYRLNLGLAGRLASRWQAGLVLPYVRNDTTYSGTSSHSDGLGDTTISLWYEALDEKSAWKAQAAEDLIPSIALGPSLTVPTGVSPYDDVRSSFDVTGRGFYRVDGNARIERTLHPWSASVSLGYGTHIERPVNREYGNFVRPYRKKPGDRSLATVSLSHILIAGTGGDKITATASFSHLREGEGTIDGARDPSGGFRKNSVGGTIAWSSTDHDWSARVSWDHAIRKDGWGKNFPTTDIYTIGVRYGYR
jgi:hypothetical protein